MIVKNPNEVRYKFIATKRIQYPVELQTDIDRVWNEFIKDKEEGSYFNGDVYLVTGVEESDNGRYTLIIGSSKYADLVYARETGLLKIRSLFSSSYLVTGDGYYCVMMNNRGTINTIGGMASVSDFNDNGFDSLKCLKREWKEEMSIILNDESGLYMANQRFIKIPNEEQDKIPLYPIGVLYEVRTPLSRDDVMKQFMKNKEKTDGEIKELLFFDETTYNKLKDQKNVVSYIHEMLDIAINNK